MKFYLNHHLVSYNQITIKVSFNNKKLLFKICLCNRRLHAGSCCDLDQKSIWNNRFSCLSNSNCLHYTVHILYCLLSSLPCFLQYWLPFFITLKMFCKWLWSFYFYRWKMIWWNITSCKAKVLLWSYVLLSIISIKGVEAVFSFVALFTKAILTLL